MKTQEQLTEEIVEDAVKLFFSADRSLNDTKLSRGAVIRAVRFAMHNELTTKEVKLQSDDEIKLAFIVKTMLDSRLLMLAKQKLGEENNGEQQNP